MSEQKSALFVCLGNICTSTIAEGVFQHLVKQRGIADKWKIDSAGLNWCTGDRPDSRARKIMKENGIEYNNRSRQIKDEDFFEFDYIFGMEEDNVSRLKRERPEGSKAEILLLSDFDPTEDSIISDPYYERLSVGFKICYEQCLRSCNAFLDKQ